VIKFDKLKYDPGDKRSYGTLKLQADTTKGKLKIECLVATSGDLEFDSADHGIWLDGKKLEDVNFDPGLVHYYGGYKAMHRCSENLEDWVGEAIEEMLGDVDESDTDT